MIAQRIAGLAPSGGLASALARGEANALDALSALHDGGHADFLILGAERLVDGPLGARTDPGSVAAARYCRFPGWGFIIAAAPEHDHPYNLARRVLTVDHFSGGRGGVVIGRPSTTAGTRQPVWSVGSATGDELLGDAALALRELWSSWPRETLVGDARTGTFARTSSIRRFDHRGVFSIDGPLNSPSSVQGEPVLAWWLDDAAEVAEARAIADLLIVDRQVARRLGDTGPEVLVRVDARTLDSGEPEHLEATDALIVEVGELSDLEALVRLLPSVDASRTRPRRTLRTALGLHPRILDLTDRTQAIPDDVPVPA